MVFLLMWHDNSDSQHGLQRKLASLSMVFFSTTTLPSVDTKIWPVGKCHWQGMTRGASRTCQEGKKIYFTIFGDTWCL